MLQAEKVVGSNPDVIVGFFLNLLTPSSHSMTLGLTHHVTEMSTRNISGE
jgi:hypothetical protein